MAPYGAQTAAWSTSGHYTPPPCSENSYTEPFLVRGCAEREIDQRGDHRRGQLRVDCGAPQAHCGVRPCRVVVAAWVGGVGASRVGVRCAAADGELHMDAAGRAAGAWVSVSRGRRVTCEGREPSRNPCVWCRGSRVLSGLAARADGAVVWPRCDVGCGLAHIVAALECALEARSYDDTWFPYSASDRVLNWI